MRTALLRVIVGAMLVAGCSGHATGTKAVPSERPSIRLVTVDKRDGDPPIHQRLQFAMIIGKHVPVKVNTQLRVVPERRLDSFRKYAPLSVDPGVPRTDDIRSSAAIGLSGPRVVSVRYTYQANGGQFVRFVRSKSDALTFDLSNGRELGPRELLAPEVRTKRGTFALNELLAGTAGDTSTGSLCRGGARYYGTRSLRPQDIFGKDAIVEVFPASTGVTFTLGLYKLGYPLACDHMEISVGYADLRGFLSPLVSRAAS